MNTIQTRGYAEKGDSEGVPRDVVLLQLIDNKVEREIVQEKTGSNKGKLVPTPAGELISGFLTDHFDRVVDYGFTADVEKDFDDIAGDRLARNTMLEKFYAPFHALIEQSGNIDRRTVGANREVGIDPKSGKPIIARFGRFGPMLQLGSSDNKADKGIAHVNSTFNNTIITFTDPTGNVVSWASSRASDFTSKIGRASCRERV